MSDIKIRTDPPVIVKRRFFEVTVPHGTHAYELIDALNDAVSDKSLASLARVTADVTIRLELNEPATDLDKARA